MKKQTHYWEVLKKYGQACHQIGINTLQNLRAAKEDPGFEAQYAAELATRGLKTQSFGVASAAST